MHFSTLATALFMATLAHAYVLPDTAADGVYSVYERSDGTEVHTKIADITDLKRSVDAELLSPNIDLERRQNNRIWCGCAHKLNHGNTDAAVADLKTQLQPANIPAGQAYYSIRGGVVAFACNRSPNRSWVYLASQYGGALADISGKCGQYVAGSKELGDPDQALIVGYMEHAKGLDFCKAATGSAHGSC